MNRFFIAKKWSKSSDFQNSRLALYRYEPVSKGCYPVGPRVMTTGQLLCYLGCPALENWYLDGQMIIFDFSITCYEYSHPAESNGTEIIKVIVIEYCPPVRFQNANEANRDFAKSKYETGGVKMKEHQFSYHLTPEEFQLIFNLLGDVKIELEQILQNNDLDEQTRKSKASQYETIQNLETRIRRDMDGWLLHYPLHTYTQWRMKQLQEYSEEIIKLFGLDDQEDQ